jgi:hypothetical protein
MVYWGSGGGYFLTDAVFRDPSAWYHIVLAFDTTQATANDRVKLYVNGERLEDFSSTNRPSQNYETGINATNAHGLGANSAGGELHDGHLTGINFIDGQALGPEYFGYTDGLTNTWRPKKYEGTFGTNGFYLPMDGNSPIGEDKSGQGNNWTPVNFGGSVALPKATGAKPILNTDGGGNVARVGVRTDAYHANLVLALPLVGSANDVSNQINSGSTTKVITANGNPTASTTQSNFYGGSFDFDASGDYLSSASSSDFTFGTGDFCIEYWVEYDDNSSGNSQRGDFQTSNTSGGLKTSYSTGMHAAFGSVAGDLNWNVLGSNVVTVSGYQTGRWYHNAITREGTTLRVFKDGILQATVTNSSNISSATYLAVGGYYNTTYLINGRIQDFRIYKGVAKYTSNFIPASTNPDILPDTPSGVSGSSKLAKVTDGAVSFDNSGDSLTVADNSDFDLGTNSFTIECFAYLQTIGQFNNIFAVGTDSSNGYRIDISTSNNLRLLAEIGGSWSTVITGGTALSSNKWYHLVVTRNGNNFDLWVDGIKDTTTVSNSGTITNPTTQLEIGRLTTNSLNRNFHGFISNLRFVNGTALYTANFTPPTRELTNVTNTKLLCCQSNTSAVDTVVVPGTAPNTRNWSARSNWNSGGTLTNASSYPLSAAFDGNLSTTFAMSYAGGMVWTAPATISFSSSIEVYVASAIGTGGQGFITTISGVQQSKVDLNAAGSWETVYSGSGTFDKLEMTRNDGGNNNNLWISAIRVDGTILVDAITANGDAAATNFNPFTTDINAVRGQESGYATMNPLRTGSYATLSDGNLKITGNTSTNSSPALSTIYATSGKYYWELIVDTVFTSSTSQWPNISVTALHSNWLPLDAENHATNYGVTVRERTTGTDPTVIGISGKITTASVSAISGLSVGDVLMCAMDADNGAIYFGKNGSYYNSGVPSSGSSRTGSIFNYSPLTDKYELSPTTANYNGSVGTTNFGQKPFKFPPPAGFQPLNAANVRPETVITRPDQYVGVTTYTGNGSVQSINVGLKPDFVWIKNRDTTDSHVLFDTIRGVERTLYSNLTNNDSYNAGSLTSFDSDGFTLGSYANANQNTSGLVAWTWRAGGNKNTFNVDDVGYASASDVGMSVGFLNSATYTTGSYVSDITGTERTDFEWVNLFNGNLNQGSVPNASSTWTFTPSSSISFTTLAIYAYKDSSPGDAEINGTSVVSQIPNHNSIGTNQRTVITGITSPLTSLKNISLGNLANVVIAAIEIDGKILVDSNQTPPNVPSIANTGASVGTKQGFSIIKYTGTDATSNTFSHGLSQKPDFAIFKNLSQNGDDWIVYHTSLGATKRVKLNSTAAADSQSSQFNDTEPTSSLFTIGTYDNINQLNDDYISYIWHDVPGLQKFGSYVGNGDNDGVYIELGFAPKVLLTKSSSHGSDWQLWDTSRQPYNVNANVLTPNSSAIETGVAGYAVDFLSNGVKFRNFGSSSNQSGYTYIYAAWAEAPTFNLYGAQSNAR